MYSFFSKYGLAAHLALLAVAPLALFAAGAPEYTGGAMLWLALLAAAWMFFEPSRREGEMLHDSRRRVARAVAVDPLTWLFAVLAAYAALRWVNGGVDLEYDVASVAWRKSQPAVPWLPASAAGAGFLPFCTTLSAGVAVAVCRNALGRSARGAYLTACALFAGASAVVALCTIRFPAFSSWTDESIAGIAFGYFALAAIVGQCYAFERKWRRLFVIYPVMTGTCAAAHFVFAPLYAVCVFSMAVIVLILVSAAGTWFKRGRVDALKFIALVLMAIFAAVVAVWLVMPVEVLRAKMDLLAAGVFPDGFAAMRERLAQIALDVWRENAWLGSGTGAFAFDVRLAGTAGDWAVWGANAPATAWNGGRQLLAERGIVGVVLFTIPAGFFAFTFVRRLIASRLRSAFFPLAALGVFSMVSAAVLMAVDVSVSGPSEAVALGTFAALSPFAFPAARRGSKPQGGDETPREAGANPAAGA